MSSYTDQRRPLPSKTTALNAPLGRMSLADAADAANDDGLSSSESDLDEDDEAFKLPASPPQLESLALPSPIFGRSFVDLLASAAPATPPSPSPALPAHYAAANAGLGLSASTRGPSRLRASSHDDQREPTLVFSNPRAQADRRVRRGDSEPFIAAFPDDDALELPTAEPEDWPESHWKDLTRFLERRGYAVDGGAGSSQVLASRLSDGLKLHLALVPIDDVSYELDVVEHLASAGVRSAARAHGILAAVPTVGIVPICEDWTAVLTERWEPLGNAAVDRSKFGQFARDVVGAVSFLHSNRIAHLALSPTSVAYSAPLGRWTLNSFALAIQGDPLAKRPTKVTGASAQPEGYGAPEMSDEVPYDPFACDLFALGRLLSGVAASSGVDTKNLKPLLEGLTLPAPKERTRPAAAMAALKALYP